MSNWTGDEEVAVVVFNSLAWPVNTVVTVPTNITSIQVVDGSGAPLEAQQVMTIAEYDLASNRTSHQLLFTVDLPPYGYQTYFLRQASKQHVTEFKTVDDDFEISNTFMKACFSGDNRMLECLAVQPNDESFPFTSTLAQYTSSAGNGEPNSGAYVFRPMQDNYVQLGASGNAAHHELTWKFFWPARTQLVMTTPRGDPSQQHTDVFVVSTFETTADQTVFRATKLDGKGWKDNLHLSYATIGVDRTPCKQILACNITVHYEMVNVSHLSNRCTAFDLPFPIHFKGMPIPFLSVESQSSYESFAATSRVSAGTIINVNVCRVDKGSSPAPANLKINILAMDVQEAPCEGACWGQVQLKGKTNGTRQQFVPTGRCEMSVYNPVVLASVTSRSGEVYAVTVFNVMIVGFSFVVQPVVGGAVAAGVDGDVTVNWLIFERDTVRNAVTRDPSEVTLSVARGPVAQEVRQVFRDKYAVTYRLYQGKSPEFQFLEQKFDVGPLDQGRELVTTVEYKKHGEVWYSDDSGLELIPRQFDGSKDEPVAANFYPMVMGLYLNDTKSNFSLSLLSERSHSSSYLGKDTYEVMLHRRCSADDGFGVGEVLNETDHIQPKLWLVPSHKPQEAFDLRHKLTLQLQNPPTVMYARGPVGAWAKSYKLSFSMLEKPLPENVHLLSLKARNTSDSGRLDRFVLRLQHTYERGEPSPLAEPVALDLSQYFVAGYAPEPVSETTLNANRERSSVQRLKWRTADGGSALTPKQQPPPTTTTETIDLVPRQIRTFISK